MSALVKYSLLSFPLTSVGLGVWQLRRLEWKNKLVADMESRLTSEPLDLFHINSANQLKDLEYRAVRVKGYYDTNPEKQIYLTPKILVSNREAVLRGRSEYQRNIGVNVITPFNVDGSDLRILINRGWLPHKGPENYKDNSHMGLGKEGEVKEVIGVIRTSDKRARFGMKTDTSSREWDVRDVEQLAGALKTAPIYLEALQNDPPAEPGIPIGGQTQVKIRNEHLNYAITWFGLSIFSLFMWYTKFGRRVKSISKPH